MKLQPPQSDLALVTNFLRHHSLRPGYWQYERELLAAVDQSVSTKGRATEATLLPLLRFIYMWAKSATRERNLADHEKAVLAATIRLFNTISYESPAVRRERSEIMRTTK